MRLEQRLANVGDRIRKARRGLEITEEQLAFQTDVANEAHTRMLVSGTPLADREWREARDDLERLRKQREEALTTIGDLVREQDRLLERLNDRMTTRDGGP
jgi:hypothetical protein